MDKFRELFALKLAELGCPPDTHRAIMDAFDQAKADYWKGQREEIHKIIGTKTAGLHPHPTF